MREYADWCSAIGVNTLDKLRMVMEEGRVIPLINLCEARQERKYAEIANQIYWKKDKCRIVMMSGPSSSGKTSSSLRIAQQCRVLGLVPKVIELDNYFVDRDKTPRNADGKYDFEALEAMDINFLGEQISDLLSGREIELPKFDFVSGTRHFDGKRMRLEKGDILFMEGIHALDPAMTPSIETDKFFKIYVSALSALPSEDKEHNSTTDKRLLRRIVRDNRTRGISPEETILYDLPVLKHYAQSLLSGITSESGAYEKAQSLLSFLSKVIALNDSEIAAIPPTSIMREFIGGQMLY